MPELVVTLKNGSLKKIDVSFGNDADKDLTILAIETYLRKKKQLNTLSFPRHGLAQAF